MLEQLDSPALSAQAEPRVHGHGLQSFSCGQTVHYELSGVASLLPGATSLATSDWLEFDLQADESPYRFRFAGRLP